MESALAVHNKNCNELLFELSFQVYHNLEVEGKKRLLVIK